MKVRIQNDGGVGYMTRVTDVETGEQLEKVHKIELAIEPSKVVSALLHVYEPVVDVLAYAEIKHTCPYCGNEVEPKPDAD